MLQTIKQRLGRDDEQGFTLIELMVVVLIIAILLAIAIPTFLGARNTANARAAQSNLRNALTAEQSYYTNSQAFGDGPTVMNTIEPNLGWVVSTGTLDDTNPSGVLTTLTGNDVVVLTAVGKDHNCYDVAQLNAPNGTATAGTYYYKAKSASTTSPYACATVAAPSTPVTAANSGPVGTPAWGLAW